MKLSTKEIVVFAMISAIMITSKKLMEVLPNIHLIGTFIIVITAVYGKKALYPIYTYILLEGLLGGFATWWIPYLYIWTVLWLWVMLLPKSIPTKYMPIVYSAVCAMHGFLFGILYAPLQAIIYGLGFKGMIAWIAAGIPFDLIHGISNALCGLLAVPLINVLKKYNIKNI